MVKNLILALALAVFSLNCGKGAGEAAEANPCAAVENPCAAAEANPCAAAEANPCAPAEH